MNGGRRGGVRSDFIREIRHHSTTHRGGQGSYVAGESSLTCCCCCCWLCGRCGLTNRSMAVADAEPPPPMIPVANGGPNGFESILATSRDFRFSSFKKAHVDMCQPFSSASNHRPSTTTFASTLRQQHVSTDSRSFLTIFLPSFSSHPPVIPPFEKYLFSREIKRSLFAGQNLERLTRLFIDRRVVLLVISSKFFRYKSILMVIFAERNGEKLLNINVIFNFQLLNWFVSSKDPNSARTQIGFKVRDANQIFSRAKFRAPIGNIDSKKFFFYIILLKSSTLYALEFEGETRRSMQVSSGNSKISSKNCLSIFPFYNLRFIPRSKEQGGNKNWKILGAHRQSFDRGPLLPTFSPAAAPIASSLEPGKFSFPANHRKIPFQDLVSLRSSA